MNKELSHLVLYLEGGRKILTATEELTDSMLCNKGREQMGTLWDKSKVKVAQTFITKMRR